MPRVRGADDPTVDDRDTVDAVVLGWFAREGRSLPWRDRGVSPWGVLVSEVMLQQTPVSRGSFPRGRAWMERWPTPAALAAATPRRTPCARGADSGTRGAP